MPRGPHHHDGPTKRQALRQIYKALWKGNRRRRVVTARVIEQARKDGFTITTPMQEHIHSAIPHLKAAAAVTHNPQYVETIEALERDGINNPRNLSRAGDERFLRKVDHLRRNGKIIAGKHHRMSDLEACECVVAEWGLGALGTSFEVEVERLRKAWIRSRRPT
jgi:hypothetical protein